MSRQIARPIGRKTTTRAIGGAAAAPGRVDGPRRLLGPVLAATLALCGGAAAAEQGADAGVGWLEGHGGPIKGIAVSPDGARAATASFDYTLGLWGLGALGHVRWLDAHRAGANAAAFTPDGARMVSGGDDYAVMLWDLEGDAPPRALGAHQNKVQNVAVSPDGRHAASAGWDGAIGLWDLAGDRAPRFLKGHRSGVNDVVFDGAGGLYSASSDGSLRLWDVETGALRRVVVEHGFGLNALAMAPDARWLAYGAVDGVVRVLTLPDGDEIGSLTGDRRPILALDRSPSGARLAFGDGHGYISVVETATWEIARDFRAAVRGPIWALAFAGETRLIAGGLDDFAAVWPIDAPETPLFTADVRSFQIDPDAVSNGERQFARKCSVCHTLVEDGRRRAGPTLFGVFGRRAGGLAGYNYSTALKSMDLVWSPETLDKLFDLGPDHFTPGSKMPMQRIVDPADRQDLIAFLKASTASAADTSGDDP